MNLASMMKQAQQMQKRLQDAQKDLAAVELTGEASNGAVVVTCDGHGKFKRIKLTAEAICPENPSSISADTIEMLEDLITTAMNQATAAATKKMEDKMKGIVPQGLHIPGLF